MNYLENLFNLNNKIAIVTGASRGIGLAIALGLHNAGCQVWGISRTKPQKSNKIIYHQSDITNSLGFQKFIDENFIEKKIDILVNAAGISISVNDQNNSDKFSEIIQTNLISTYRCCEIASKKIVEGGSIINITSIGAYLGFPNNPGYQASKSGISGLTRALAYDLSLNKIRVNNIVPGYIKTDMTYESYRDRKLRKQREDRTLLQRWGEPKDLVGAALFLASETSSYVTGIDLVVDGGWMVKGL